MNNTERLCGALIGNVITTAGWLQDMENIVSIVCCIAGFIITLITCVIVPVWKKILEAKKDGNITPDELGEIADTLQDGINSIKPKDPNLDKDKKNQYNILENPGVFLSASGSLHGVRNMSKLEELKQMVAELFEQATDTTTIQKSAVVGAKIDEIAKEEQELVDKHAELIKEYRQAVIHSSFKPDGHNPEPTPSFDGDSFIANWMANQQKQK